MVIHIKGGGWKKYEKRKGGNEKINFFSSFVAAAISCLEFFIFCE